MTGVPRSTWYALMAEGAAPQLRLRSVPWIEDELQAWMHELETRLLHPNPGRGGWPRGHDPGDPCLCRRPPVGEMVVGITEDSRKSKSSTSPPGRPGTSLDPHTSQVHAAGFERPGVSARDGCPGQLSTIPRSVSAATMWTNPQRSALMAHLIHDLYPYLCVRDVEQAIRFYEHAFGAKEHYRLTEPGGPVGRGGRVGHAEIRFGANVLMLAEEYPEMGFVAPAPGEVGASLHLHVDDADGMFEASVAAGATAEREPTDQFYGERSCTVRDPFGYRWMIGHSIEDVDVKEMQRRYDKLFETT
jgi:uncharacterized glyoxalase superfamily protein PhnB